MSYFINICFICLKHSKNIVNIRSQDTNGTSIGDKLKYFLPGFELNPNTPKYICAKCDQNLCSIYEFKQICLRNITTYEKYAQQITTIDGSFKCLSVNVRPDFVCKIEAVFVGSNHDTNSLETQTVKEEINEDPLFDVGGKSLLGDIKEENYQSDDRCPDFVDGEAELFRENNYDTNISEEFIIKEETDTKLIINDESQSLLHEVKRENPESNDTCNKNYSIGKNAQTVNDNIDDHESYVCDKTYPTKVKVESQILSYCKKTNKCLNVKKNIKNFKQDVPKLYKCKICNKSYKFSYSLKKHVLAHANRKPYTCEVCNKPFKLKRTLEEHKYEHTGKKLHTCDVCNQSFSMLRYLKRHRLIHSDEKPFTCKVCNKTFRRSNNLLQHQFIHTVEKPFTCEVCNKSFKFLRTLKEHKYLHTGEKPFICEVCKKPFRHAKSLHRHKMLHTDEKPFMTFVINHSENHAY